jgi:hypothetical protein
LNVTIICDTKHNVYKWAGVTTNILLVLLLGFPLCLAGYRLFQPALFVFGFGTCFCICYQLIIFHDFHGEKEWVIPLCASIAGLIGGLLSVALWQIGLFIVGFSLGGFSVVAALMVLAQLSASATNFLATHAWLALIFVLLVGITVGALTIRFEKPFIVAASAVQGSWIIMQAVDFFVENTGRDVGQAVRLIVQFIPRTNGSVTPWHHSVTSCALLNACFSVWPAMLLIGVLVQVCFTAKGFDHNSVKGKGRYFKPNLKPDSFSPESGYAV